MSRPTRAIVDLAALRGNLERIRSLHPGRGVIAVVKANAYGHGLLPCASELAAGADGLAVAIVEEALPLLKAGFSCPLLVLEGPQHPSDLRAGVAPVEWVVHENHQIDWLRGCRSPVNIWLKVNIGMNRLGLPPESLIKTLAAVESIPGVALRGIITHYACADEAESVDHRAQLNAVARLRAQFPALRFSCANSAAAFGSADGVGDGIRPGIALYGASPFAGRDAASLGLRPVMRLVSQIMALRTIGVGQSIGYGATWRAQRETRMGVIPIGYADGFMRRLSPGAEVVIAERRVPLVGRVSMDMVTVDLTDLPAVGIGSEVELWGSGVTVDEQAEKAGTLGYELLSGLSERVEREYLKTTR